MRSCLIFHRVLNELEAGQSYSVKGQMIGPGCIANGYCCGPEIMEWGQPGVEDRTRHIVPLQENSSNLAAAIVEIEVPCELGVCGLERHCFAIGEVFLHIGFRAEQSLFLATP